MINFEIAMLRILKLAPQSGDEEVMRMYDEVKYLPSTFTYLNVPREPMKSGAFIARLEYPTGLF